MAPKNVKIELFDLEGFPHFNQDIEDRSPKKVKEFKAKIKSANAILIATPEYNYSVPGVLKNAIDWASRPYGDNAFDDKPAAIMSTSSRMLGGARAQYHLRQTFIFLNMHPVNKPEVMVPFASVKTNESGKVKDEKTKEKIRELLEALAAWVERLRK